MLDFLSDHLDIVVHLAFYQLLPTLMPVTLLTVDGKWNPKTAALVLLTIGTFTLFLLKFFMKHTDGALKQDCRGVKNKHHAAESFGICLSNTTESIFKHHNKIVLSKIISYAYFLLYSPVIGLDLESHSYSREKVQFFETRLRIIFLALTSRDEIEIII